MPKFRYAYKTGTRIYKVPEYTDIDEDKFKEIVAKDEPAVIRKCPFGESTYKWTLDYLTDVLGEEEVMIHVGQDYYSLDFLTKNFKYEKCKFSDFARRVEDTSKDAKTVYLRSTSKASHGKAPARIEDDFPALAADLKPPSFIPYGKDNPRYYSSVLRISSKYSRLWLHFDLYSNVLCQVVGVKTVYLFHPSDSKHLEVDGDKSKIQDMDDWLDCTIRHPGLLRTKPYECHLHPGDFLYIPSMWWHQVLLHEDHNKGGYSIGFNIFWKDELLEKEGHYAANDIYGNKNLIPYDAALLSLKKSIDHLDKLPGKYNDIYKVMFRQECSKRLGL